MSLDANKRSDHWQRPHRNRQRWIVTFYLKGGFSQSAVVGVPEPIEANLKKYRDEMIAANREDWHRPMYTQKPLGIKDGKMHFQTVPVLDEKGHQIIDNRLLRVTAYYVGADI